MTIEKNIDVLEDYIKRGILHTPKEVAHWANILANSQLNSLRMARELIAKNLGNKKKSNTLENVEARLNDLQTFAQSIRNGETVGMKEIMIRLNVLRTAPNSKKRKIAEENADHAVYQLRSNPETNAYAVDHFNRMKKKTGGAVSVSPTTGNGNAHHRAFPDPMTGRADRNPAHKLRVLQWFL